MIIACGVAQEKNTKKCVLCPQVKHGKENLMAWGCMSSHGVGGLHVIIITDMYCKILNTKMIPSLKCVGRRAIFQHDNVPKHSVKMTSAFLKKKKVKVLDWPSVSPDLNPVAHYCSVLKNHRTLFTIFASEQDSRLSRLDTSHRLP